MSREGLAPPVKYCMVLPVALCSKESCSKGLLNRVSPKAETESSIWRNEYEIGEDRHKTRQARLIRAEAQRRNNKHKVTQT